MSGFPAANGSRSEHERARDNDDLDLRGWMRLTVRGPLNPALEPSAEAGTTRLTGRLRREG